LSEDCIFHFCENLNYKHFDYKKQNFGPADCQAYHKGLFYT